MKNWRANRMTICGLFFCLGGVALVLEALLAGSHAFHYGTSAVVALCCVGLLLLGSGAMLINKGRSNG